MSIEIDHVEPYESKREVQLPFQRGTAFGETFGFEVPTQYSAEIHSSANTLMAADSILTPMVFGMSSRMVWFTRALAGVLWTFREGSSELPLRRRLEIESGIGAVLVALALRGIISRSIFERLYLLIGGVMMIGNAMMTQVEVEKP
jgi:hypothetical protein